jgi:hypothetical protein
MSALIHANREQCSYTKNDSYGVYMHIPSNFIICACIYCFYFFVSHVRYLDLLWIFQESNITPTTKDKKNLTKF